jgi:hypothetical protein
MALADERDAKRADYGDEPVTTQDDLEVEPPEAGGPGIDLIDVRLKLEAKLTWLAKHLLAGPDAPTFFARAADQDVANVRATVLDGLVRKTLADGGWTIEDFAQDAGHRPDFIAAKDTRRFRVTPRFVTTAPIGDPRQGDRTPRAQPRRATTRGAQRRRDPGPVDERDGPGRRSRDREAGRSA